MSGRRALRLPADARGLRLDQALAAAFPDLSRARLQGLIRDGRVQLDGKPVRPSQRLSGGERAVVDVPAPVPAVPAPEDLPIRVLWEDGDLLVLDKAAGVVVHPAAGHAQGTLVNALLHHVRDLRGVGGVLRPGIVHRLDKDTSGCLVVAKTDLALAGLQTAFASRAVTKTYLALVHGQPEERGRLETAYGRHPRDRKRFSGRVVSGKRAITEWRVVRRLHAAALLEVNLQTGRTHQIRAHLAEAGHPLVGDALYGGTRRGDARMRRAQADLGRQALHAWRLAFLHPRTGATVACEARVPEDFTAAMDALGG